MSAHGGESELLHEVFLDPRSPYSDDERTRFTLQIHSMLPEQVKIGHYVMESLEPVVEEVVGRAEYLRRIQEACAQYGETYTVRFYDHLDGFDASVLDALDEIRTLVIDPVSPMQNPEAVGRLPKLTHFRFSPRGKNRADILGLFRMERLETFTLGETSTPLLDLSPLREAQKLRSLRLLAQGKNLEAIGDCAALTELSIHPTDKVPLDFINRLQQLEVLKFSLGRTASIAEIGPLPKLRDLSFDNVAMLEDLGDLQRFPRLRRLQINYQRRLKTLRVGRGNAALEHINVSGIDQVEGFSELPALRSFNNFNGKFAPDWSELPPTLTHFALVAPSLRAREKHYADVRAHGLEPELHPEATFFYK
jgi:hypothetical protein